MTLCQCNYGLCVDDRGLNVIGKYQICLLLTFATIYSLRHAQNYENIIRTKLMSSLFVYYKELFSLAFFHEILLIQKVFILPPYKSGDVSLTIRKLRVQSANSLFTRRKQHVRCLSH